MWQSILCYLSGQHEFTVVCEPDAMFLQCRSCGSRSHGWALRNGAGASLPAPGAPRVSELVHAAALSRQHHSA